MAIGMINSGLSGLYAAQAGLATTGNNIANASTPGYNRQVVEQTPAIAVPTGSGFIGQGTDVTTVSRVYSQFLNNQVLSAQTQSSQSNANYTQIQQIDNMLASTTSGLSSALQSFFSAIQTAANDPTDTTARQALLDAGNSLTTGFNSMDQQLVQMNQGVNSQIASSVSAINNDAQQIAQLNQNILTAQSNGSGQPPNNLLDQRDAVIANLNQLVQTTALPQADGTTNVLIGNGQPLVLNTSSFTLSAVNSPSDPTQTVVAYSTPGSTQILPDSIVQGGSLGGLLQFRDGALASTRNTLGQLAMTLADTFNQQSKLGQDANGAIGGAFFNIGGPQATANANNTGNAVITASVANSSALTTSDYQLSYDGSNYTLTRLSDGSKTTFAAFPQTVDGVTLSVASGAASAGDRYLIQPTVNGAGSISMAITDPSKLPLAAPIMAAQGTGNTGNAQISAGSVNGPPPVNANLQQPVTITFTSPTTYSVSGTGTGNPAGVAYVDGSNVSYNGWTVQISGTPVVGDTFTIGPNSAGAADNRNALALANLQTANLVGNNTMTYSSAYANLVGTVGNSTQELNVTSTAQTTLLSQATAAQQSFSGVNLDEEAANLMRYQQAYEASAKVIAIASKLFDSILQIQ